MHRFLGILFLLVAGLATAPAHAFGWRELPNTRLLDVCPPSGFGGSGYDFPARCKNVVGAWNSGAYDPARNRLYIWGGGHADYAGNEVYALDLNTNSMLRLTDPGVPLAEHDSIPAMSEMGPLDGTQPNSRHTYDGLTFIEHADRMWAFSGALSSRTSSHDRVTWLFDPAQARWQRVEPAGDIPNGQFGIVSAYDPVSGKVFLHDRYRLYSYEFGPDGGRYERLGESDGLGIHATAVIDPERRKLFIFGPKMDFAYDIGAGSDFTRQHLESTGDLGLFRHEAPGLAYDPVDRVILGWVGDGKVYRFDPDTRVWSSTAFNSGPGAQPVPGTYGRFVHVPARDEFVVYNQAHQNAFVFTPPRGFSDSTAPTPPASMTASAALPTVVKLDWSAGADDFGVAGYNVYRDGQRVASTTRLRYSELGLSPGTDYRYEVTALDSAGHESAPSTAIVRTPGPTLALPRGNCAAEAGLHGRDDVLLCEPWEKTDWWTHGYLRDPIVNDPRPAIDSDIKNAEIVSSGCFSGNCLKVNMLKGETNGLALHWPLVEAEQAPEELFIRYYIRLAPDWSPDMCDAQGNVVGAGGKFPGIADPRTWADPGGQCGNGGARGDGVNCWSMRANYRDCTSNDGNACATKPDASIRFGSYLYHYDQFGATGDAGHWDGDDWNQTREDQGSCASNPNNLFCGMGDGGVLERDRWYRVEMQVKMNTPGQSDGVIRGWIDGALSFEKTNTVFRLPDHDMLHNRVVWLNVYKGGTLGNCNDSAVFLDQLVVATGAPPGGIDSDTVQPPDLDFEVSPRSVLVGDPVNLEWRSSRADTCTASGAWSGERPLQGNAVDNPAKEITSYEIACTGSGGTVRRRLDVDVDGGTPLNPIAVDEEPPARPQAPGATLITDTRIDLQWPEATDDHGVSGYRVFRNGVSVATVTSPAYSETSLLAGTAYRYAVDAFDAAGNFSARSEEALVTTNGESASGSNAFTLYPDSDTYTHGSTTSTLGANTRIEIGAGSNTYLRFPLDAIPPGAKVKSARLHLYSSAQYGPIERAGVFRADKDWHESVTTKGLFDRAAGLAWDQDLGDWTDQAGTAHGELPFAEQTLVDDDTGKWVQWDVTNLVQAWHSGAHLNQGLVLRSLAGNGVHHFQSKEHVTAAERPRLEVEIETESTQQEPDADTSGVLMIRSDRDTFTHGSTVSALGEADRMEIGPGANAYFHFPLTEVPAGAHLRRARLLLYSYAQYGHIASAGIFRADKTWRENATRSRYDDSAGLAWDNLLGDWRDAVGTAQGDQPYAEATLIDDDVRKWVEWDVTAVVRQWLDGAVPNQGLVLRTLGSNGIHAFRSKEYSAQDLAPRLELEFGDASQETEYVAVADTFLTGSTYRALGSLPRIELYRSQSGLIRFDVPQAPPGTVVEKAILRVFNHTQYGHMPEVGVFHVDKAWTETGASRALYGDELSQFWQHYLGDWLDAAGAAQGGVPYAAVAIEDDDNAKWVEWDVTALVQAWSSGQLPNNGLMLRSLSGSSTHLFSSREDPDPARHPRLEVQYR